MGLEFLCSSIVLGHHVKYWVTFTAYLFFKCGPSIHDQQETPFFSLISLFTSFSLASQEGMIEQRELKIEQVNVGTFECPCV